MNFYILDDDIAVVKQLELIINSENLGMIVGKETNCEIAIDEIRKFSPDIVLIDLLMPDYDGITIINRIKEEGLNPKYIMISQVSDIDLKSEAYNAGVSFFISKPVNKIEVIKVIENVVSQRILENISKQFTVKKDDNKNFDKRINKINRILINLGISGEKGINDLQMILEYIIKNELDNIDFSLSKVCKELKINSKNASQRIRRALAKAITNLAYEGLDDHYNANFSEYSNTLFQFSEVKKEMDFIKGKSKYNGTVNVKMFMNAILILSCE